MFKTHTLCSATRSLTQPLGRAQGLNIKNSYDIAALRGALACGPFARRRELMRSNPKAFWVGDRRSVLLHSGLMDGATIRYYDTTAATYDSLTADYKDRRDRIAAAIIRHAPPKARVLDLGCGTGVANLPLFDREFRIVGVDGSEGMLNEARKRPFESLVLEDLNRFQPESAGAFHVVSVLGAMEFVDDPPAFLERVASWLDDPGIVAITFPDGCPKGLPTDVRRPNSFSRTEVEELVAGAGLRVVEEIDDIGYSVGDDRIQYITLILVSGERRSG